MDFFFLPTPKHEKAKGIMRKGKSERCIKENKINVERFSFFAFFFFLLVCMRMVFSSFSFRGMHSIDIRKVRNWLLRKIRGVSC